VALLKCKGFNTFACNGGEEAVAAPGTMKPDLILPDIMMELTDGWETPGKIKADPVTRDITVLMFSVMKITPEGAEEHCLSIEDFVSKPVNPAQLLDVINRIFFERRKAVKTEAMQAKNKGVDPLLIEDYSASRKCIGADKNLLVILKKSSGTHLPEWVVPADELAAISRLETKILADEQWLHDINGKFNAGT
jgi:CheY-like chemotaxis protein